MMPDKQSTDQGNDLGPCLSEALWVTSRPEFTASERLKTLLLYIAKRSDRSQTEKISQLEIARDIMGLRGNFDPTGDAHVRIEISRLRLALGAFYSSLAVTRARRLSIPKGAYRTELEMAPHSRSFAIDKDNRGAPIIALGTLYADDEFTSRYAFETECELHTVFSASSFAADALLWFIYVDGSNLDALADRAFQLGASTLLVTRVIAKEDGLSAYLLIVDPKNRRIVDSIRLGGNSAYTNNYQTPHAVALAVAADVLDPVGGRTLPHIFLRHPDSRISHLSDVFAFMGNQDRKLLPTALAAAKYVSKVSQVAQALTIDMSRASFCFGTDSNIKEVVSLCDQAEALVEKVPNCIWSNLALGYAGVSGGREDLVLRGIAAGEDRSLVGAQNGDLMLLQSISDHPSTLDMPLPKSGSSNGFSVFDSIRFGYAALRDPSDELSNHALSNSNHKDVFWIQAFQISALVRSQKPENAKDLFDRMQKTHPDVQNYMRRAITTMIADVEMRDAIVSGLETAAG